MKISPIIIFVFALFLSNCNSKNEKIVEASCGQCNFDLNTKKGCDLAVRFNDKKAYFVKGAHIDDFGDSHDLQKGLCNVIRKAEVVGNLNNNTFISTSFKLID